MNVEPTGPVPGPRLDHYRLVRRLAAGGMAEIFLAVDERDGRSVALKRILPQIAGDSDFRERFFHEIRIQISLKHRNVVELLDCNPGAGEFYIVMEYVDGGTVYDLLRRARRLPWEVALYVCEEALRGLGAAHRKGIIHRDVKPQNIMWTREGVVKIADFGVSQAGHLTRLTVTGTVVGTPSFMSPEQAKGETLDPRSDLFSAGTVLYELLTGSNPFAADSIAATLRRVVDLEPEPPSGYDPTLPPNAERVLRRLHAKDRARRFDTAEEAGEALRAVLRAEGIDQPASQFREFAADPEGFVAERGRRLAAASAAEANRLLADRSAPPEQALWAAYQTIAATPQDAAAQELFRAAASRVGQREGPVNNPKIRELEDQIRIDPENPQLLLQLAKLYRLEKDFLNVMRFFRKLSALQPADPYTRGQIASLLTIPAGAPAVSSRGLAGPVPGGPATGRPASSDAASAGGGAVGRRGLLAAIAGAALAIAFGVWWMRGPARSLTGPGPEEARRVEGLMRLLRGAKVAPPPPAAAPANRASGDELLQKALEKGALIEKDGGPAKAEAFYREVLSRTAEGNVRAALLMTVAETALRAGSRDGALAALDEAAALPGPSRDRALYQKALLLESGRAEDEARRIFEELSRHQESEVANPARLRLALAADRSGDVTRALTLYEEILARSPDSPEANPSRLGAAALYRAAGRKADARRLYEEVERRAAPGSDDEKSARAGLSSLP